MSDLLKVRVGGSDYLCKYEPNFVVIGGRKYPDLAYAKGSLSAGPDY